VHPAKDAEINHNVLKLERLKKEQNDFEKVFGSH
jgi:hypothetical protein